MQAISVATESNHHSGDSDIAWAFMRADAQRDISKQTKMSAGQHCLDTGCFHCEDWSDFSPTVLFKESGCILKGDGTGKFQISSLNIMMCHADYGAWRAG